MSNKLKSPYSPGRRLQIYTIVRDLIRGDISLRNGLPTYRGLCRYFAHAEQLRKLDIEVFSIDLLPEVWRRRPKKFYGTDRSYWWDPMNLKRRLQLLDEAIAEVETLIPEKSTK